MQPSSVLTATSDVHPVELPVQRLRVRPSWLAATHRWLDLTASFSVSVTDFTLAVVSQKELIHEYGWRRQSSAAEKYKQKPGRAFYLLPALCEVTRLNTHLPQVWKPTCSLKTLRKHKFHNKKETSIITMKGLLFPLADTFTFLPHKM